MRLFVGAQRNARVRKKLLAGLSSNLFLPVLAAYQQPVFTSQVPLAGTGSRSAAGVKGPKGYRLGFDIQKSFSQIQIKCAAN